MKAEERKEIEQNSLIHTVQNWRAKLSGRGMYYVLGTVALIVAVTLLWQYFAGENRKARDTRLLQLENADTPEKLEQGIEDHRGTVTGSLFKLQLARHKLLNDGLPKLATDRVDDRRTAASAVQKARDYFVELADEFAKHKEMGLVQQAWEGAAEAEEALVGFPKTDSSTEYRGDADKAIEYYAKAGAMFPETEFSKKLAKRAETLKAKKTKFIADQKLLYEVKAAAKFDPALPANDIKAPDAKAPESKKEPEPKKPEPPKTPDIKTPAEPKKVEPTPDPKKAPEAKTPMPETKTGEPKK